MIWLWKRILKLVDGVESNKFELTELKVRDLS